MIVGIDGESLLSCTKLLVKLNPDHSQKQRPRYNSITLQQ